jgi:hypothetical protein
MRDIPTTTGYEPWTGVLDLPAWSNEQVLGVLLLLLAVNLVLLIVMACRARPESVGPLVNEMPVTAATRARKRPRRVAQGRGRA